MIGNAHLDPVWLWQWQEGFQAIKATFRSALDRMAEYEDFIFTSSSAAYYEWVEQNDPSMFRDIQMRIAEGRWVLCGGWWIQPDCNLPSGEAFVRQSLYGQLYFQEKFGVTAKVGYNVDSFGHNAMLPQILKKSGMDSYVMMRPDSAELHELPAPIFWWEADDGSRVLTYRIPDGYNTIKENLSDDVNRFVEHHTDDHLRQSMMLFFGVGNHGGGPTKRNIESIQQIQQKQRGESAEHAGELLFSSPNRYFEQLNRRLDEFPVWHNDLQHSASGCYSAHSGVKQWNRKSEHLLVTAEKLSSVACMLNGIAYPDFQQAWKNLLFNHFHDIIAGCSIPEAYDDAKDLYGEANAIASRALNHALQSVSWSIGIEQEDGMTPVVVFNPHCWDVDSAVELEFGMWPGWVGDTFLTGAEVLFDDTDRPVPFQVVQSHSNVDFRSRICFQAKLPALGYRVYRMYRNADGRFSAAPMTGDELRAEGHVLENAFFRLTIDPESGGIASLFDKRSGIEVFRDIAALPVVLEDRSNTWSHNVFHFADKIGSFQATKVSVAARGPVKAAIRVTSTYNKSICIQEFTLYAEKDQIEVKATVDWREQNKMLKLEFPLPMDAARGTYEIPYGHIERPLNGEEEPVHGWADMTGVLVGNSNHEDNEYGVSLLNDGKYSCDMNGNVINLTVLRSPLYAHYYHFSAFEPKDEYHYEYMDQGKQTFHYAIVPHRGDWRAANAVRRAAEFNQRPIPLIETYHPGPLPQQDTMISVDQENIVVSAIKKAEHNGGFILRCYETHKRSADVTIQLPKWQRTIKAHFQPCEIKTLRIPADLSEPIVETDFLERPEAT